MKVMTIFGTRPEAIKIAPIINELASRQIEQVVCVTGQHREMLDQMLDIFHIKPDYDLNIMTSGQSLGEVSAKSLMGLEPIIEKEQPDVVVVQGDTTTAFMGALASFYHKIPVAHVEAGLRTNDRYNPYPEEINRRLISQIAEVQFAPTHSAESNLLRSDIHQSSIYITGNTVIDALLWVADQNIAVNNKSLEQVISQDNRIILVTTHRRENLGEGMEAIFSAIKRLATERPKLVFFFPVHLNPAIQRHASTMFKDLKNVILTDPLSYSDIAIAMKHSYLVMTDSGGIQEEAPSLGKPVLVMRETTERHEGIEAGTGVLVGIKEDDIYHETVRLLDDDNTYNQMAHAINPYGDGTAAKKIADILTKLYGNA
jgi:UDP-N-acetylglucosamine 2-epimerase (non-hydrolysing)